MTNPRARRIGWTTLAAALALTAVAGAHGDLLGQPVPAEEIADVGIEPWNPSEGPAEAPVTIVVFGEYLCPFCKRLEGTLDELQEAYGDRIRIVRRNRIVHPPAEPLALAALAAGMQGRFGRLHELLFAEMENLREATPEALEALAERAGLDVERFRRDVAGDKARGRLDADLAEAERLGVRGTPTVFLNGRRISGARPTRQFGFVIDELLGIDTPTFPGSEPPTTPIAPRPRPAPDPDAIYDVPLGDSPARGARRPLVTVVVFNDFQCPFCSRAVGYLEALLDEHPGDLRVVFKHLPLPMHARARAAAEAAAAAAAQDRFWEMHDLLFAEDAALEDEDLERYAREAGCSVRSWRRAIDRGTAATAVDADLELARTFGVTGTPTFFVNGRRLVGASEEGLRTLVEAERVRAQELVDGGTSRRRLYRELMEGALDSAPARAAAPPVRPPEPGSEEPVEVRVEAWNPLRGPAAAPVTIVVFGEYRCRFCQRLEGTLRRLEEAYGAGIRIVYRNLIVHPDARPLALAAIAAGMQGGFEAMHERLFAAFVAGDPAPDPEALAAEIGLDVERFREDFAGEEATRRLEADLAEAGRLGVRGTPTTFVNGRRLGGAQPAARFGEVIDALLGIGPTEFPE